MSGASPSRNQADRKLRRSDNGFEQPGFIDKPIPWDSLINL